MIELTVADMTCNHCVQAITRAIGAIDSNAKLAFDLPSHRVRVTSDAAPAAICQAIEEAGYTVQQDELRKDVPKGSGCCCAPTRPLPEPLDLHRSNRN